MLRHSLLARFLRQQALYLAIAVVGYAVFLAIGLPMKPAPVILYSLCFGNLVTPSMNRVRSRFSGQSPAHRWLIFLAALAILTPIVYATSSVVVVWIAPPYPQSLEHLIRTGWKFPCLMIFVYGVISLLYFDTKERLERRNAELQLFVERSTAQLEMQDQELQRAREIQESLLPTDIPQIPGFEVAASLMCREKESPRPYLWPTCRRRCALLPVTPRVPRAYAAA
jgi:hypothetical protein